MTELFPLVVNGACTSRNGKILVGPVDLKLDDGGATVVMGPNGSGKTTLLRLLHGTARITKGEISWGCPTSEARQHQAFVFQKPIMLRRSVFENLVYPLRIKGVSKTHAKTKAFDWAKRIGISDFLELSASVLSGGEQQKLALARAMITNPKVLFLDEPTASLDGRAMREIEDILLAAKAAGTRLILSTHDIGQARRMADDIIFLLHGRVHEQGSAAPFFDNPKTVEAGAFLRGDIVE